MRNVLKGIIQLFKGFCYGICLVLITPFFFGVLAYGTGGGGGITEQQWLDRAQTLIQYWDANTTDPEIHAALRHAIKRYTRIGPFDVFVTRCSWCWCDQDHWTAGINAPWCPGITLDLDTLYLLPLDDGAGVLVHEGMHDLYPWFNGHSYIRPIDRKIEKLAEELRKKQYVHRTTDR